MSTSKYYLIKSVVLMGFLPFLEPQHVAPVGIMAVVCALIWRVVDFMEVK